MSHVTRWLRSTQFKSHLAKIGGHCPCEGRDKAFFCISRDHLINESHDSVGEIPSSLITKVIVRATELSNKNICVLQIGANLCYKLGQLHYYKLEQVLLQIGAAITN